MLTLVLQGMTENIFEAAVREAFGDLFTPTPSPSTKIKRPASVIAPDLAPSKAATRPKRKCTRVVPVASSSNPSLPSTSQKTIQSPNHFSNPPFLNNSYALTSVSSQPVTINALSSSSCIAPSISSAPPLPPVSCTRSTDDSLSSILEMYDTLIAPLLPHPPNCTASNIILRRALIRKQFSREVLKLLHDSSHEQLPLDSLILIINTACSTCGLTLA